MAGAGTTLETIKTVRSHPQGFAQCREFLDAHSGWNLEICPTTADAVQSISKEIKSGSAVDGVGATGVAAIASEAAARAHGLKIIKAGIENNSQNYTRFAIITRRLDGEKHLCPPHTSGGQGTIKENIQADKASLVFSVKDEAGSLYECLKILSGNGINLSKLESRPILGQPWNYLFYIDVTIPAERVIFDRAIEELRARALNFHFLGAYKGV
jgi:3-deoxy-7-phosphoheptulonate synthase